MPTGYTAAIKDGITFEQFVLNCARAFGALITMRDEPAAAPIPDEFAPSDYHTKALTEARAELKRLENMSHGAATVAALKEWEQSESDRRKRIAEKDELRRKYEHMLARVKEWHPPTPEHVGMRDFMIQQITESIEWDCGASSYDQPKPQLDGDAWLAEKQVEAMKNVDYHEQENAKEIERAQGRTAWVKALRDSLSNPTARMR